MGYRSQVRMITTKKGFEELKKFNDDYLKQKNGFKGYSLLDHLSVMEENEDSVYFGWDMIKWYEESKSVEAILKGLGYLEKNDFSYRFTRIGEAYDDFEEKFYDSEREEEQHLDYPCVRPVREFAETKESSNLKL